MTDSLLLHSGHVFTGTELHPTATAVLVQGGQIAAVGTDAELEDACPRAVRRLSLIHI